MEVHTALEDELDAAGAVALAAYEADGLSSERYRARLADARSRAEQAEVLVAVAGGEVVGTVTLVRAGTPMAQVAGPGEVELRMLGTAPAARGRGVARALVLACLERARAAGAQRVVLSSQVAMTAAHGLYASLGFVRDPALDHSPGAEPDLLLLGFALPLAPG